MVPRWQCLNKDSFSGLGKRIALFPKYSNIDSMIVMRVYLEKAWKHIEPARDIRHSSSTRLVSFKIWVYMCLNFFQRHYRVWQSQTVRTYMSVHIAMDKNAALDGYKCISWREYWFCVKWTNGIFDTLPLMAMRRRETRSAPVYILVFILQSMYRFMSAPAYQARVRSTHRNRSYQRQVWRCSTSRGTDTCVHLLQLMGTVEVAEEGGHPGPIYKPVPFDTTCYSVLRL